MMSFTRRQVLLGATALASGIGRSTLAAAAAGGGTEGIDDALRAAVRSGHVPGVVALAAKDQGQIYAGAFGARSAEKPDPMTLDSVFWIASMTKAVTTTAAMQMVEEAKLDLDAPAETVLPELASVQVLEGFDPSGQPRLRARKRPITLRRLLTHTAGFTYEIWDADNVRYQKFANLPPIGSYKNDALKMPLAFDPGDRWEYGINIDFAGKMVEKVSGKSLEAYFKERIFDPLGMSDTGFKLGPSQRQRLVGMHTRQPDGTLKPVAFEMPQDPEFFMGGGGLYSTGPDYLKFVQAFLHEGSFNGARILKPETVAEMSRNQIGDINVTMLKTVQPESSGDAEFFPGMQKKWGLGFMINTERAPTGRSAGSLAWAGLANTYFWIDPAEKVAGVIMMQLLPFTDPGAMETFTAFETGIYQVAGDLPAVGSSTPGK